MYGAVPAEPNVTWVICRNNRGTVEYFVAPVNGKQQWTATPHEAARYSTRDGANYQRMSSGLIDTFLASRTTM